MIYILYYYIYICILKYIIKPLFLLNQQFPMVFVRHPGIFVDSAVEAAAMFRSDAEMIARPAQRSVVLDTHITSMKFYELLGFCDF